MDEAERVAQVAARMAEVFGTAPRGAVVLGSGLGGLVDALQHARSAPYGALGLPESTVPGHAGRLVVGTLAGVPVAVCAGRVHLYEGRSPSEVVRGVRALARWGVPFVLLTNAVGGIRDGLQPGSVVIVTDHLNLQGQTPLAGPAFGERFPDMTEAYHPRIRQILQGAGDALGIRTTDGVLAAMPGPAYETPAEVRMLAHLGADVVGMSTVPEVLAAAEIRLPCAAVSLVANRAAGLAGHPLTHAEVVDVTQRTGAKVVDLIRHALPAIVSAFTGA